MKKVIGSATVFLFASLLSACATIDYNDKREVKEETVYVTGSNLPKRDRSGVKSMSKEEMESALSNSASGMPTITSK